MSFFLLREPGTDGVGLACTDATWDLSTAQAPLQAPRLREYLGLGALALISQVHGTTVVDAHDALIESREADAVVTSEPGTGVCVRVADCLPVLLWDEAGTVVAAAHAGRVGFLDGVLPATVDVLRQRSDSALRAWIGPHVCGACYEVPQEMVDATARTHPLAVARTAWGTPSLDLARAAAAQLDGLDVGVTVDPTCTLESRHLHSYRRDGAASGRLAAVAWLAQG